MNPTEQQEPTASREGWFGPSALAGAAFFTAGLWIWALRASEHPPALPAAAAAQWQSWKSVLENPTPADKEAFFWMGRILLTGDGAAKDEARAFLAFQQAARWGHARAQLYAGTLLLEGRGTSKDARQGYEWLHQAARQGEVYARFELARLHFAGETLLTEPGLAVTWLEQAARNGVAEAQAFWGRTLMQGREVPADPVQGFAWIALAAEAGEPRARGWMAELEKLLDVPTLTAGRALVEKLRAEVSARSAP